jgi:hypothetical protein
MSRLVWLLLAACGGGAISELDAMPPDDVDAAVPADAGPDAPPDAQHDAAPIVPPCPTDGVGCDDGDACTRDDQCQAGACTGTPFASVQAVHGAVTTYGAEPIEDWMEGAATFVADDRILFLESTKRTSSRLSLVRVGADGLVRLDEAESRVPYQVRLRTVIYWGKEASTYVVPMGADRFVVVGSLLLGSVAGMEVFGFAGDVLESRGFTPLPSFDDILAMDLQGAVAHDEVLYLCGAGSLQLGRKLRAYQLDEVSSMFTLAAEIDVPSGGCNELALSPDGTRLFLAANGGYRVYDVTDPTRFVVPAEGHVVRIPDHFIEDIEVGEDHVVAMTAQVAGELDDAFLFDRAGTPAGVIAMNGTPFGMALLGDRLFVESFDGQTLSVAFHDLATPGAPEIARRTFHQLDYPDTAVQPAARGDLVALQPWRRVLRADLDEVTGPAHGSARTLVARADTELLAFGPQSWQRLDVESEDTPAITAGGMVAEIRGGEHELLVPAAGAVPVLGSPHSIAWHGFEQTLPRERFALYDATTTPPTRLGRGTVDGPREGAGFGFGHGLLFQVMPEGNDLLVRRYAAAELAGLDGQSWRIHLTARVGATSPRGRFKAAQVSRGGDQLLVSTIRAGGMPSSFEIVVTWIEVSTNTMTVVAEGVFPTSQFPFVIDGLFTGEGAILLGNDRLARVSRDGSTLALEVTRDRGAGSSALYQRILGTAGGRLLVTRHDWKRPENAQPEHVWFVDAIDPADLSTAWSIATPDEVLSIVSVGEHTYLAMNAGVLVVTPACEAP